MANDDWRITVEVEESEAGGVLDRLAGELGAEARELAADLKQRRLSVSRDGETIFIYSGSRADAEKARAMVESELRENDIEAKTSKIEHWLDAEERWDDEPPTETWEEEELDEGYAPWEVRVECGSRQEAGDLAERLEAEATSRSASPTSSSSVPQATRMRRRSPNGCTARSRRAARSFSRQ